MVVGYHHLRNPHIGDEILPTHVDGRARDSHRPIFKDPYEPKRKKRDVKRVLIAAELKGKGVPEWTPVDNHEHVT